MPISIDKIVFTIFLVISAIQDGRTKTISIWLFIAAGAAGLILTLYTGQGLSNRLLGCLIGIAIVGISRFTDGAIGEGDGWFFAVSGLFLDFFTNLRLLVTSVFLSGIVCGGIYIYFLLKGKDMKKASVPFLPFLIPAWISLVIL
jgi:leader peptidase (prepilin peptidase)/N-methyltransferase